MGEPTYDFLYNNYAWPEPGTERNCPFSGIPLQLNERRPGYNGKPWTCPQCVWYFSEEELSDPDAFQDKDCPHSLRQAQARPLGYAQRDRPLQQKQDQTADG